MIPIYICDDNKEMTNYLKKAIENLILIQGYDMEVVLVTTNPEELLQHKQQNNQRSIYFLDVDLKNKEYDGFTLAKEIRTLDTRGFLIYVTTHDELIYETFKYRLEAMSYLVKEKPEKLGIQIYDSLEQVNTLIIQETDDIHSYYTVKIADSNYQIPMEEILFFETSNGPHRVIVHTKNRMLEFRGDLSTVEKTVGAYFCKVHRSYLVQLNKIKQINYSEDTVVLENDAMCLLSRKGKKLLKHYFENKNT